jgi:hypothetical protein
MVESGKGWVSRGIETMAGQMKNAMFRSSFDSRHSRIQVGGEQLVGRVTRKTSEK